MDHKDQHILSQLMHRAQEGDQEAYKELFAQIGPVITKMIRQRIKDENTVEDIYQTVLMTIHRARHTFDSSRPFKPWMNSITRNTIFDYLRKNRKNIELEVFVGQDMASSEPDTTAQEMILLQKALSSLPANQQEAVKLLKIEGLSLQAAAKKSGTSVGALKVRAHRGCSKLKKILIDEIQEVL